jgi:hypothetical protein
VLLGVMLPRPHALNTTTNSSSDANRAGKKCARLRFISSINTYQPEGYRLVRSLRAGEGPDLREREWYETDCVDRRARIAM